MAPQFPLGKTQTATHHLCDELPRLMLAFTPHALSKQPIFNSVILGLTENHHDIAFNLKEVLPHGQLAAMQKEKNAQTVNLKQSQDAATSKDASPKGSADAASSRSATSSAQTTSASTTTSNSSSLQADHNEACNSAKQDPPNTIAQTASPVPSQAATSAPQNQPIATSQQQVPLSSTATAAVTAPAPTAPAPNMANVSANVSANVNTSVASQLAPQMTPPATAIPTSGANVINQHMSAPDSAAHVSTPVATFTFVPAQGSISAPTAPPKLGQWKAPQTREYSAVGRAKRSHYLRAPIRLDPEIEAAFAEQDNILQQQRYGKRTANTAPVGRVEDYSLIAPNFRNAPPPPPPPPPQYQSGMQGMPQGGSQGAPAMSQGQRMTPYAPTSVTQPVTTADTTTTATTATNAYAAAGYMASTMAPHQAMMSPPSGTCAIGGTGNQVLPAYPNAQRNDKGVVGAPPAAGMNGPLASSSVWGNVSPEVYEDLGRFEPPLSNSVRSRYYRGEVIVDEEGRYNASRQVIPDRPKVIAAQSLVSNGRDPREAADSQSLVNTFTLESAPTMPRTSGKTVNTYTLEPRTPVTTDLARTAAFTAASAANSVNVAKTTGSAQDVSGAKHKDDSLHWVDPNLPQYQQQLVRSATTATVGGTSTSFNETCAQMIPRPKRELDWHPFRPVPAYSPVRISITNDDNVCAGSEDSASYVWREAGFAASAISTAPALNTYTAAISNSAFASVEDKATVAAGASTNKAGGKAYGKTYGNADDMVDGWAEAVQCRLSAAIDELPRKEISLRQLFGDNKLWCDAFAMMQYSPELQKLIPSTHEHFVFNPDVLNSILLFLTQADNDALYIAGPTGCGKTSTVLEIASRLRWPVESITLSQRTEIIDLIGHNTIVHGQLLYRYGPLARAMMYGEILVLNEIDLISAGELAALNDILEGRALTISNNNGEVIYPHPFFRVIATANTKGDGDESGYYQGARLQNQAFLDRWRFLELSYPTEAQERSVIAKALPMLSDDFITNILHFAQEVRRCNGDLITTCNDILRATRQRFLAEKKIYDEYLNGHMTFTRDSCDKLREDIKATLGNRNLTLNVVAGKFDPSGGYTVAHEAGIGAGVVVGAGTVDRVNINANALAASATSSQQLDSIGATGSTGAAEGSNKPSGNKAYGLPGFTILSAPLSTRALMRICKLYAQYQSLSIQEAISLGYASRLPLQEFEFVMRMCLDVFGSESILNEQSHTIEADKSSSDKHQGQNSSDSKLESSESFENSESFKNSECSENKSTCKRTSECESESKSLSKVAVKNELKTEAPSQGDAVLTTNSSAAESKSKSKPKPKVDGSSKTANAVVEVKPTTGSSTNAEAEAKVETTVKDKPENGGDVASEADSTAVDAVVDGESDQISLDFDSLNKAKEKAETQLLKQVSVQKRKLMSAVASAYAATATVHNKGSKVITSNCLVPKVELVVSAKDDNAKKQEQPKQQTKVKAKSSKAATSKVEEATVTKGLISGAGAVSHEDKAVEPADADAVLTPLEKPKPKKPRKPAKIEAVAESATPSATEAFFNSHVAVVTVSSGRKRNHDGNAEKSSESSADRIKQQLINGMSRMF